MEQSDVSKYEVMVILHPDLGDEKTKEEFDEIRKLITGNDGEIYHEDVWGLKDLSYSIKKQDKGFYIVLNFSMEPGKVKDVERNLTIQKSVLRFLLIKTPYTYEMKNLADYEAEAEEAKKAEALEKAGKEEKRESARKAKPVVDKKEEKETKVKKAVKAKAEKPEEVKEETQAKSLGEDLKDSAKDARTKLDEMDKKLKSIIDDPDISL